MSSGRRKRDFSILICALALIGQLLLPIAHAQAMANRSNDPRGYLLCGESSPATLRAFSETVPKELLARIKADEIKAKTAQQQTCNLCASVHGGTLTSPHQTAFAFSKIHVEAVGLGDTPLVPHTRLVLLPPLRAPPVCA